VKEHTCQVVSREELAAYTDGDLTPNEAEQIAAHINTCPDCRALAEALESSLKVTKAIWQTSQARWPETRSFDRIESNRLPFNRAVAIAAGVLLILGVGAIWRLLSKPSERIRMIEEKAKVAELRLKIADAGDAARLLAAAQLLSKYPDAEGSVKQRYRHIAETYPETAAAAKARLKLQ